MFRIIFHIDTDSFYTLIEKIRNSSLKDKSIIIQVTIWIEKNNSIERGVVATYSYYCK